jgi:hypothetical protein
MIHTRGRKVGAAMPDGPFVPLATMFKLDGPDSSTVECIACHAQFPLADLLQGELEEDMCPKCRNRADVYWKRFAHRVVPAGLNGSKED